jgi:hypothetical protein
MVTTPEPKKGATMDLFVVVIVAIVCVGLFRYMRTRPAR